jgi:hypothetical protein
VLGKYVPAFFVLWIMDNTENAGIFLPWKQEGEEGLSAYLYIEEAIR